MELNLTPEAEITIWALFLKHAVSLEKVDIAENLLENPFFAQYLKSSIFCHPMLPYGPLVQASECPKIFELFLCAGASPMALSQNGDSEKEEFVSVLQGIML